MKARPAISRALQSNKAQSVWQRGPIVSSLVKGAAQWQGPAQEQPCPTTVFSGLFFFPTTFFLLCFVAAISSLGAILQHGWTVEVALSYLYSALPSPQEFRTQKYHPASWGWYPVKQVQPHNVQQHNAAWVHSAAPGRHGVERKTDACFAWALVCMGWTVQTHRSVISRRKSSFFLHQSVSFFYQVSLSPPLPYAPWTT